MSWLNKDILFDYSIYNLLWYFFIYAFLGWCMEVCYAAFKTKGFINRGFLNGCWCPLYGAGATMIIVILDPVKSHPALIFLLSMLITSFIEFMTGWVLELLYHKKWWDYSMRKFNLCGYICLEFSVIWGVLCLFVYDILQKGIAYPVEHVPTRVGIWALLVVGLLFVTDLIISTIQATRFAKYVTRVRGEYRKISDTVGQGLADVTVKALDTAADIKLKLGSSQRRILKAFPSMSDKFDKGIILKIKEKMTKKEKAE